MGRNCDRFCKIVLCQMILSEMMMVNWESTDRFCNYLKTQKIIKAFHLKELTLWQQERKDNTIPFLV